MTNRLFMAVLVLLPSFFACQEKTPATTIDRLETAIETVPVKTNSPEKVAAKIYSTSYKYSWKKDYDIRHALIHQIDLPKGYERLNTVDQSFGDWLRFVPLFPEGAKVHYYDGREKWNQDFHHRVIDMDVGKKDLQQCADAIMRLKAEYHYSQKEYKQIHFNYTSGDKVSFEDWRQGKKPIVRGNRVDFSAATGQSDDSYSNFRSYMYQIFNYAGTASLSKEMKAIKMQEMQIGDVFIEGGHPGHAVLIMDMAQNEAGEKVYLLAQSYMPAQEFHILKNIENPALGPWHQWHDQEKQSTAEWAFSRHDLKRF